MEEKSPEETRSTESDTSSSKTVVSSSNEAVVVPRESNTMNMAKPEYTSVRRRIDRPTWNPEKHSHSMQVMQRDLNNGFRHCRPGCEREVLNQSLRPSGHILWNKIIAEVKSDLFSALAETYPSMQLEVFGSALMGIAFKDSDLNFYLNLFPKSTPNDTFQVMNDVMKLLSESHNFTRLMALVPARSPILNCMHLKTGAFCQLNFFDCIGTIVTPILAHLLAFDARIDFLATVIKFWMKVHHCYGQRRITNYAVLWLLVFYLQSIPEPIIPPIIHFQSKVSEKIINDFNYAFDYNLENNTRNEQRCSDLLLGFFKFYAQFDFKNLLICPLFGRAFNKKDVCTLNLAEFTKYEALLSRDQEKIPLSMKYCICIQDPFEITNTIPVELAPRVFSRLADKIEFAAEVIEHELHHSGESTNLFVQLFDVDLFHRQADVKSQERQRYANSKY